MLNMLTGDLAQMPEDLLAMTVGDTRQTPNAKPLQVYDLERLFCLRKGKLRCPEVTDLDASR
jgi:hypothetical protein